MTSKAQFNWSLAASFFVFAATGVLGLMQDTTTPEPWVDSAFQVLRYPAVWLPGWESWDGGAPDVGSSANDGGAAHHSRIARMSDTYYPFAMTTISLKVPDALDARLAEEAQRRRTSKSAVIRECVEKMLLTSHQGHGASCLDLAADLAGCLEGPRDLATNPRYLEDFGR